MRQNGAMARTGSIDSMLCFHVDGGQVLASKSISAITSFYKRECQEKKFPGDWKERKCSLYVPAHVMLRDSGAFLFFQIHLVIVTALSTSEARQAVWLKGVNHGSI
jgi:hypothetical protein